MRVGGTPALAQSDTADPDSLTVDRPTDSTVRRTDQSLTVGYSYEEANPDVARVAFEDDAGNAAVFRLDDSGYAGDNEEKTETLDLSAPDSTAQQGLVDGSTYALQVTVIDTAGNPAETTGSGTLTIDETAPTAEITSPTDGAVVQSQSTIEGTAADDVTVASVELTIQRDSDDQYWDGGSWVGDRRRWRPPRPTGPSTRTAKPGPTTRAGLRAKTPMR